MPTEINIRKLIRTFENCIISHEKNPSEETEKNLDKVRIELFALKRYADSMTATVKDLREQNHLLENKIAALENTQGLLLAL